MAWHHKTKTSKKISLPGDIGPHLRSDIEWWYYYAILNGYNGGKYAAMAAFYQTGEIPPLKGHYLIFSLIDLEKHKSHSFSLLDKRLVENMLYINIPAYLLQNPADKNMTKLYGSLLGGRLPCPHQKLPRAHICENSATSLSYGDSSLVLKNSADGHLKVFVKNRRIEAQLEFNARKPVILVGGNGKPDRLYYYSFTRNDVKGCVKTGKSSEAVSGEGWFDHQWGYTGDLLVKTGWNWFGLQLEDGRELLINEFRSVKKGCAFSPMANLIEPDGLLKFTRDLALQPSNYWRSPQSNAAYPLDWVIAIPEFGMVINVSAIFPEQEMPVIGPLQAIWEGACSVSVNEEKPAGSSARIGGKGFMELVGYANYK